MNENKAIKSSLEDLKSPSLDTSHEPLVSKPELAELKAALETHISTVVKKDEARLAEQQKLEGLLTSHRSDLDKKQAKLQAALNTHISTVVEKDKARLTEQQKHEDLVTGLRGQFENFKQMTETAFTGMGERVHQQNSVIGADIDDTTRLYLKNDNIVSKLRNHQKQLSRFSSQQIALDTQLSILKAEMDSKVEGLTLREGLRELREKVDTKEDKSVSLYQIKFYPLCQ